MKSNLYNNFFQIDKKIKIHYQTNFKKNHFLTEEGSLPLLVFNYGLVCSNEHWSKQIPFFNSLNYPILLHDYRGHFKSTSLNDMSDCHFTQFAIDLNLLIKEVAPPNYPIIMIGHSMGVNITLEFHKLFPNTIQKMVLISGSVIPPQDTIFDSEIIESLFPLLQYAEKKFPQFFNILWKTNNLNPLTKWLVLVTGFNYKTVPISFINTYLKKINKLGPKLFLKLFEEMNQHNIISDIDKITTPTLVIGGEKDKIIPNSFQEIIIEKIPKSEFYLLKDGGHVPQIDHPDLINQRIHLFLKKKT